jgi:uncharacterized protein DUF3106
MLFLMKFRRMLHPALAVLVLATATSALAGQGAHHVFGLRSMHSFQNGERQGSRGHRQEHLDQWMNRHSHLPPAQQQRALENEPGFRHLPPQTQQNLRNRLSQLDNMPPEQRRRLIERNEAIERLTPPERQQFRGAMQRLGMLPADRRRMVAHAFRDLREMPPAQRQAELNSDRFRSQFSPQERATLSQLLEVAPFLPVPHSNGTTESAR